MKQSLHSQLPVRLASVLSNQRKDAEAETLLRSVVELVPRNTNARLALAAVLEHQGKFDEAEKEDRRRSISSRTTRWC